MAAMAALVSVLTAGPASAAEGVTFSQSAATVDVFGYLEVTAAIAPPPAGNPFVDLTFAGEFTPPGEAPVTVDGFCDAQDGGVFRVRFMPRRPGRHGYRVTFRSPAGEVQYTGSFQAQDAGRRGLVRVDARYPRHFVWTGTGEHYFWNGTTAYYLMGWDEDTGRQSIDRLAGLKVNRLRVLLYGRNQSRPWGQPVVPTDRFKLHLNPWLAERPDDIGKPGFDLTRFNVEHWRKYERLLQYAREKDVVVSVIFFIGAQVLPTPFAGGSVEEDLYYRYGVARFAAFSNVAWDLGNEYNFHRMAPDWADAMGRKVKGWDPYDHLCSAHNVVHRTAHSTWCDMQLIQRWDAGQNAFMLSQQAEQATTGRVIPQINEEYGYEDLWEKRPGQRRRETRRRCAWEIALAGCYQTAGESARTGTGVAPDTGGGWVNGRGDDSMLLLHDNARMRDFFAAFDWWTHVPANGVVAGGGPCLASAGTRYVVYLPEGGHTTLTLPEGKYRARWFDPRTAAYSEAGVAVPQQWVSPEAPDRQDWVLLLERDDTAVDRAPPRIVSAVAVAPTVVQVTFSKALDPASAAVTGNYSADGLTVREATLADDAGRMVRLVTSPLTADRPWALRVRHVRDRAEPPNAVAPDAEVAFTLRDPTRPLVVLAFDEGAGETVANTGATAATHPAARLTDGFPRWAVGAAPAGGNAIDFGEAPGEYAVDLGDDAPAELRGLKSFTLTGWVNCRSLQVGSGGNRVVHMADTMGSRAGLDLVVERDGSLVLGVNGYPDHSPARSHPRVIPADPTAGADNWRFLAVTYAADVPADNVRFYVGDARRPATLDCAITYSQGPVGPDTGSVTFGAFNPTTRGDKGDRVFRGLVAGLRIYGSAVGPDAALNPEQIRAIQSASAN